MRRISQAVVVLIWLSLEWGTPGRAAAIEAIAPPAASASTLDAPAAARFATLALACLHEQYPNHISHTLDGDSDARPPYKLTPAFYGCYDWHSDVHGHWLLVRLLRLFPEAPFAPQARDALAQSLTAREYRGRGCLFQACGARLVRAAIRPRLAAAAVRGASPVAGPPGPGVVEDPSPARGRGRRPARKLAAEASLSHPHRRA